MINYPFNFRVSLEDYNLLVFHPKGESLILKYTIYPILIN